MLVLKRFSVLVNGEPLVGPISCTLSAGEFLAITGPNGSGKTTLLRGLLGLLETSGELRYERHRVERIPAAAVGYVPQRFHFPGTLPLTVREFLALSDLTPSSELCGELEIGRLFDRKFSNLSGGELQRVILARALARHPELLILDEASAGIDSKGRAEITELLIHLMHEHNVALITVTHDSSELNEYRRRLKGAFHELALAGPGH